ncbi:MAG: hypothetical protein RRB13_03735 [bacterium]|nr:hypothetical protein [bacterium]
MTKSSFALLTVFLLLAASPARAKLIEPEGLILKILEHYESVRQFDLEVTYRVFDPEALAPLGEALSEQAPPSELPNQGYRQDSLMIRDEVIVVETKGLKGDLLHLTIAQMAKQLDKNFSSNRLFSQEEAQFLPLLPITKHPAIFKGRLAQLGIDPAQVGTERQGYNVLYRLGGPEENILIDPKTFRILAINRRLNLDGRDFPLQILFIGVHSRIKALPQTIRYYVAGRLYKEAQIGPLKTRGLSRARRDLLEQYKNDIGTLDEPTTLDFALGR